MPPTRHYRFIDRLLIEANHALATVFAPAQAARANPAGEIADVALESGERQHAAGLMRINHTGEICAQALYMGQAAVARDDATRGQLLEAAQEETEIGRAHVRTPV